MKQLLAFILIIFTGIAYGKQIDEATAKTVGQHFLSSNSHLQVNASDLVMAYKTNSNMSTSAQAVTCFYVFNLSATRGFVIVSADDNVNPVLAYSDESSFDASNIPANVAQWLDGYTHQISYVIEKNIQATLEISNTWKNLLVGKAVNLSKAGGSVSPLVQTLWDQSPNYNALCPYDAQYKDKAVTGCVATAMAQVMKYWNFPIIGAGNHSYTHQKYGTLSADFGSTTYQWNDMPKSISSANNAIATLMYHCGVSVDMGYNVASQGGSGAWVLSASGTQNCTEYALKTYFGYNSSTLKGIERASSSSDDEWIATLQSEINAGRPIIHTGFGSVGGHCFVCDGYDKNNFFHFNWGWSGQDNAYFSLNNLNPGGDTFNDGQQVLIGIQPMPTPVFDMRLYNYVTPSANVINYGDAFSVSTNILNNDVNSFTGDYCAAVYDNSNSLVGYAGMLTGQSLAAGNHFNSNITFSNTGMLNIFPGKYHVGILYRASPNFPWTNVSNSGSYANMIEINVVNTNEIALNALINFTPAIFVKSAAISVNANVINNGSATFSGLIDASLYNTDGTFAFAIQQLNVNIDAGSSSGALVFSNASLDLAGGNYFLVLKSQKTGGALALINSVTPYNNPVSVSVMLPLQPDMYELNNTPMSAYRLSANFVNNHITVNTQGSNCHVNTDKDYYNISFPTHYNYTIIPSLYDTANASNGQAYTLDAAFSYSTDAGNTWSNIYHNGVPDSIYISNGGTVYFLISPFAGGIGTYLLQMNIARISTTAGIEENVTQNQVITYPNPAKDFVNIDMNGFKGQLNKISLMNIQGLELFTLPEKNINGNMRIPLHNLSEGIYILQLHTDQGTISKKIMIGQ